MPNTSAIVTTLFAASLSFTCGAAEPPAGPPALVVVIVIDQFPASLLRRHEARFSPGGFRRLMARGAWFEQAHYPYAATLTGVGHATISTGALSAGHGIAGNDWYDRESGRAVYCVEDAAAHWIGAPEKAGEGTSPRNLQTLTFGDEWVLANRSRPRAIAVSLKDRGSILLGGKLGKAFWYDERTGLFVTSTYYYPAGELPAWVAAFNARKLPDSYLGATWDLLLPRDTYLAAADDRPYEIEVKGLGTKFPYVLGKGLTAPGPDLYKLLITVPQGNDLVLELARAAIAAEQLGRRGITDILLLSLTANDYCGHNFGPESLEYQDITLRTDRQLEAFLDDLDRLVGLDRCLVVLTSDHGATPTPEDLAESGLAVARIDPDAIGKAADAALDAAFGADDWAAKFLNPGLFLRQTPRASRGLTADAVEQVAAAAVAKLPGVASVITRDQVARGALPSTAIARSIAATYHPQRSPDVFVVQEPYWYLYKDLKKYDGMHGSPYAYDTHVPVILWGPGVAPGRHLHRISPASIAPTVAHFLGMPPPASCDAEVLAEVFPLPAAPPRTTIYSAALPPVLRPDGSVAGMPVTVPWPGGPRLSPPRPEPIHEGGFSALAPVRSVSSGPDGGGEPLELWTITDRGPNVVIDKRHDERGELFGEDSKYFPVPGYQPSILRLALRADRTVVIAERILLTSRGQPLSGLPPEAAHRPTRETAYSSLDRKSPDVVIPPSPVGYDLEGLAEGRLERGGERCFWACEEYGPSILLFDGDGRLLREYVPGAAPAGEGTPRSPAVLPLPRVLRHRRSNRGLEGLCLTDQVYAILQSPLDPGGGASGEPGHRTPATRLHRLLALDPRTGETTLFAYEHLERPEALGALREDVKVGDIAMLRAGELLVCEYAEKAYMHVYRIRIAGETTRLGESQGVDYEAGKARYTPVHKELVLDAGAALRGIALPVKAEGIAVAGPRTIALGFDNDYGFEGDDAEVYPMSRRKREQALVLIDLDADFTNGPASRAATPTALGGR